MKNKVVELEEVTEHFSDGSPDLKVAMA